MASVELPQKIFDYPGRAKSEVWMHFGFYKVDYDLDTTKAVCRHCRRIYTNKGKKQRLLSNLWDDGNPGIIPWMRPASHWLGVYTKWSLGIWKLVPEIWPPSVAACSQYIKPQCAELKWVANRQCLCKILSIQLRNNRYITCRQTAHGWPSTQPDSLHTAQQRKYTQPCSLFSRGTTVWTMGHDCVLPGCMEDHPWHCEFLLIGTHWFFAWKFELHFVVLSATGRADPTDTMPSCRFDHFDMVLLAVSENGYRSVSVFKRQRC